MRTFSAALSGFLVASALMLAGEWGSSLVAKWPMQGEYYVTTFAAIMIALLYTGVALILGAYVVAKMQNTSEAITGFLVFKAFFGFGLIREFWSSSSSWYSATAMLLIIPCTIVGRVLARSWGGNKVGGSGLAISRQWLIAAALLLPPLSLPGQLPDPGMIGTWSGSGEVVVNWTKQRTIHVRLVILPDGSVSGEVGDARLANGRLSSNRGAIGRLLKIKTDYVVEGKLRGAVISAEHIQRHAVRMPLMWNGSEFSGGLHTSGSAFGGAERMIFSATHLRLTRGATRGDPGRRLHHSITGIPSGRRPPFAGTSLARAPTGGLDRSSRSLL